MQHLDLTLAQAEANLALDETLLDACEENSGGEILRFWESPDYFVTLGFSNQAALETNLPACQKENVSICRRCSGGGTVLQGPGCLNYALILRLSTHAALETISGANQYLMNRQRDLMGGLLQRPVRVQGHTDLSINGRKFSGNAQRRRRYSLLFHGTLLLDFDFTQIEKFLAQPSREPEYREGRGHEDFLVNLPLARETLKKAMMDSWCATLPLTNPPSCEKLLEEKYLRADWNFRL